MTFLKLYGKQKKPKNKNIFPQLGLYQMNFRFEAHASNQLFLVVGAYGENFIVHLQR